MKKLISLALALTLALVFISQSHLTHADSDTVKLGDVNNNGGVDSGDATLVLRYVVGISDLTDEQFKAADMNEDGQVTSGDATLILRRTVQGEQGEPAKILVAYFSRVGNTDWEEGVDAVTSASINVVDGEFVGNAEFLAKFAQEVTGGDLFFIKTVETYPSEYRKTTDEAQQEKDDNVRPELASHVENMDEYDTIILIYPCWWSSLPMPLFTFLEEYDFSGKTILPICTHGGSAMGRTEREIAELCPDAKLLSGLAVRAEDAASAQSRVEEWIKNSGILD